MVEVQEAREVLLDALQVQTELLLGEEVTFGGTTRRVADHAGGPTHEGDNPVPGPLELRERLDGHIVAGLQAGGRGIEADVKRQRLLQQLDHLLFGAGTRFHQVARLQEIIKLHLASSRMCHSIAKRSGSDSNYSPLPLPRDKKTGIHLGVAFDSPRTRGNS